MKGRAACADFGNTMHNRMPTAKARAKRKWNRLNFKNMLTPFGHCIGNAKPTGNAVSFSQWEANLQPEPAFQIQLPAIIGKVAREYYPVVTLPEEDHEWIDNWDSPRKNSEKEQAEEYNTKPEQSK